MEMPSARSNTGKAVLASLATALLLKVFIIDLMIAEGRSMLPAIKPGSVIIIYRAAYGLREPFSDRYIIRWAEPKPGEIVVFPSPDGKMAIKRCVAGPGAPVPENVPVTDGITKVPENQFLALGDNRDESYDSRNYGFVNVDAIKGKALGL